MNRRLLTGCLVVVGIAAVAYAASPGQAPPPPAAEAPAAAPPSPEAPPPEAPTAPTPALTVKTLVPGFELGRYRLPIASRLGPGETVFVRLDPAIVKIDVSAATSTDGHIRTASAWGAEVESAKAVAVMNSSMFQDDWLKSVGHMEVDGEVQNARWAPQQNSVFAANPVGVGPSATLLDLSCTQDRDHDLAPWRTLAQSIRLLGCSGEVVWAQSDREWSSAIIGQDRAGRLLFLHTRAPYSMHDLAEQLRTSPLDLVRLHYTEGGPEASLYVRGPGVEQRHVGSYESGFKNDDSNVHEWELPNVVVAVAR